MEARSAAIETYVREKDPASSRLSTTVIVSSAVTATLAAGPGLGGSDFTETVQRGLSLEASEMVWRVLCLAAVAVSLTAAVSAQLEKAGDLRARIGAAQVAGAVLDGLRARVEYGGLAVEDAAQEYRDVVAAIPFVPARDAGPSARSDAPGPGRAGPRLVWAAVVVVLAVVLLLTAAVGLTRGLTGAGAGDADGPVVVSGAPTPDLVGDCSTLDGVEHRAGLVPVVPCARVPGLATAAS